MVFIHTCSLYFYASFVGKRTKAVSFDTSSNGISSASIDLNLPLPGGKCCLVKVIMLAL